MKVRLPPELTVKEKKAMYDEINRQIVENEKHFDSDYEAMILWTLHECFGFGKERLLRFRSAFIKSADDLREHYMTDCASVAKYKLESIGINIDELITIRKDNK